MVKSLLPPTNDVGSVSACVRVGLPVCKQRAQSLEGILTELCRDVESTHICLACWARPLPTLLVKSRLT